MKIIKKRPGGQVVGKAADARALGLTGQVACSGCGSTSGTLKDTAFFCNTPGCRFGPAVGPKVKKHWSEK